MDNFSIISFFFEGAWLTLLIVTFGVTAMYFLLVLLFSRAKKHLVLAICFAILSFLAFGARIYLPEFLATYIRPLFY